MRNEKNATVAEPRRLLHSILPADYMGQLLQRERARAERNEQEFSVILFRVHRSSRHTLRLIREILKRIRITDEVGWLSHRHLCIFLPDTRQAGAGCFAADIARRVESHSVKARYNVFSYPHSWYGPQQVTPGTIGPDLPHVSRQMSEPAASVERRDRVSFADTGVADGLAKPAARPRSLERLFVKPLPWWKRMMDIFCSGLGLLMLSPLLAVIAVLIKLTSKGPVIFQQARAGLGGRSFMIYKFRTMVVDAEARKQALRQFSEQDGPAFKLTNDPRITRIGRILRTTSLDELPQLWNVFIGDMSLVGPRPLPCEESDGCSIWQRRRLDVTPGLTCIWQVEGRSRVTFAEWMRMDIRYLMRRNLFRDLSLILKTVPAILLRKGAR